MFDSTRDCNPGIPNPDVVGSAYWRAEFTKGYWISWSFWVVYSFWQTKRLMRLIRWWKSTKFVLN